MTTEDLKTIRARAGIGRQNAKVGLWRTKSPETDPATQTGIERPRDGK